MPNDIKHVAQMNGVFVMDALHTLKYPASLYRILKHIAHLRSVEPSELRDQIEEVVENGVKNGFIKKTAEGRYYVSSGADKYDETDNNVNEEDEEKDSVDSDTEENQVDKPTYSYSELSKSSDSNGKSETDCTTRRQRRKNSCETRKSRSRSRRRRCK